MGLGDILVAGPYSGTLRNSIGNSSGRESTRGLVCLGVLPLGLMTWYMGFRVYTFHTRLLVLVEAFGIIRSRGTWGVLSVRCL